MKFTWIPIVFITAFAGIFASCHDSNTTKPTTNEAVVYQAFVLDKKQVASELILPGELEGYYETEIAAKVNGYIKSIAVDIGDRVTRGELLAELEAPELRSQLTGAFSEVKDKEAAYLTTKGKYVRLLQANKTPGAVSPYDMDLIRNNIVSDSLRFLAAKAGYESIKQLTEYLLITAPFDGIVTNRSLSPGALVGPGGNNDVPILKLKSETKLRLHIAVPERNLGELTIGKNVKFKVKSFPEKTFHGRISRRGKSVDRQTRSEIVEIVVDNPSGQLLPGMFAHATIPLQRPGTSFVVPSESIVTNMERSFVVKMAKGKATWVDIEQGENQGDLVEIFGDLHEGDTLLHTASDEIRNGTNLKTILVDL